VDLYCEVGTEEYAQPATGASFGIHDGQFAVDVQLQAVLGTHPGADVAALAPIVSDVDLVRPGETLRGRCRTWQPCIRHFASCSKRGEIHLLRSSGHESCDGCLPVEGFDVEKGSQRTKNHTVCGPDVAKFGGCGRGVDESGLQEAAIEDLRVSGGIPRKPGASVAASTGGNDGADVGHDRPTLPYVWNPANRFGPLEGGQHLGASQRNEGAIDV